RQCLDQRQQRCGALVTFQVTIILYQAEVMQEVQPWVTLAINPWLGLPQHFDGKLEVACPGMGRRFLEQEPGRRFRRAASQGLIEEEGGVLDSPPCRKKDAFRSSL